MSTLMTPFMTPERIAELRALCGAEKRGVESVNWIPEDNIVHYQHLAEALNEIERLRKVESKLDEYTNDLEQTLENYRESANPHIELENRRLREEIDNLRETLRQRNDFIDNAVSRGRGDDCYSASRPVNTNKPPQGGTGVVPAKRK